MNKALKSIVLAAVAAAGITSAQAQYVANDLLLGVTGGSSSVDLVINLGFLDAVNQPGAVVNLSSVITASDLAGFGSSFQAGVVGGQPATAGRDLYATQLRGALGTATVAGSLPPTGINRTQVGSSVGDLAGLNNSLGLGNTSASHMIKTTVPSSDPGSWQNLIAPGGTNGPGQFQNDSGINPMGTASGSLVYLDLYREVPPTTGSNPFNYLGYFTLDNSGASPILTFTSGLIAVPEPSTYGVIAAAGLLVLSLGRQFTRRLQA
jgi:hypothetical protein